MPGIMQASTQHMPTKPRKAASTCIDCKSKNDASAKLNSNIRAALGRENYVSCTSHVVREILFAGRIALGNIGGSVARI